MGGVVFPLRGKVSILPGGFASAASLYLPSLLTLLMHLFVGAHGTRYPSNFCLLLESYLDELRFPLPKGECPLVSTCTGCSNSLGLHEK